MIMETETKNINLNLTKDDAMLLHLWIEQGIFDEIRNDYDVDNLNWVHKWIHIAEQLNDLFKNKEEK